MNTYKRVFLQGRRETYGGRWVGGHTEEEEEEEDEEEEEEE